MCDNSVFIENHYLDALDIDDKVAGDKEGASKRKRNG